MSVSFLSRHVITLFSFRRIRRGAIILGIVFGIASVSQTTGLVKAYPTPEARDQLVTSLKSNVGLRILFGSSEHLDSTVRSYANWRILGILTVIGSIWATLVTTRLLRGEEETERWELLLSSPVTARQATRRTVFGIWGGVLIAIILAGLALTAAGSASDVAIGPGAAFLFTLTLVSGALMFTAVASLTSQLASTRSRAAMMASAFLGFSFLVRAIANTTESAHWLRNINPLSWIDAILPLTAHRLGWFIPIFGFTLATFGLAIFLSGRRDFTEALIPQRDTAKARLSLLRGPFRFAWRLTRGPVFSWLAAITFPSIVFGMLSVTAASILDESSSLTNTFSKVLGGGNVFGEKLFLSMGFLLIGIFVMAIAASAVQAIRSEEARETLDNLLVRPIRRLQWLAGRVAIAVVWILVACVWTSVVCWLIAKTQHSVLDYGTYLTAGLNMAAPALCILGIGLATFGLRPRWTAGVMYSVIGWGFLVEILGPLLHLPAWLLDTSILHHVAATPAVSPNWTAALVLASLGLVLGLVGAIVFNRRDLQNE
jgi:ABC-2 type transport system permease protein